MAHRTRTASQRLDPRLTNSRLSPPTLILGGGSTSPVPQHRLVEVAERIPDAQLVTIEGAGHAIQRTRPAEFLAAVDEWLDAVHSTQLG
jgi:pimeloyl-ACP methyl ester carboxylesterase